MIMDIKDAHKVIENLQTRPYICSENTIELDNGYVIAKKEYFKGCQEARERQREKKVKNRKLLRDFYNRPYSVRGDCPNCGSIGLLSRNTDYCNACGQKLNWSDPD